MSSLLLHFTVKHPFSNLFDCSTNSSQHYSCFQSILVAHLFITLTIPPCSGSHSFNFPQTPPYTLTVALPPLLMLLPFPSLPTSYSLNYIFPFPLIQPTYLHFPSPTSQHFITFMCPNLNCPSWFLGIKGLGFLL